MNTDIYITLPANQTIINILSTIYNVT